MSKFSSEPLEFIILVGRKLHSYGAAAHHIEAALIGLSNKYCEDGEFFVTPTALICSVKIDGVWESRLQRVVPEGIHLGRLSRLDEVGDLVINGSMTMDEGIRQIKDIDQSPDHKFSLLLRILFFVIASTGFGGFMVFEWHDLAAVSILALGASTFLEIDNRFKKFTQIREFILAAVVSFFAYTLFIIWPEIQVSRVILSSLIVLIPGLSITIALSEIATNNWLAGTSRLMGAAAELLKMTFGVVIGSLAAKHLYHLPPEHILASGEFLLPEPMILLFCSFAFSYMFANLLRDYIWVAAGAFLAYYSAKFGNIVFGQELGVFWGGAVLAAFSNGFARFMQRPALTVLIPGLIPMVPGSIGFRSLTSMYHQDVMGAMTATFNLVIVAVALVAGLTIGNMVVHPRRSI